MAISSEVPPITYKSFMKIKDPKFASSSFHHSSFHNKTRHLKKKKNSKFSKFSLKMSTYLPRGFFLKVLDENPKIVLSALILNDDDDEMMK